MRPLGGDDLVLCSGTIRRAPFDVTARVAAALGFQGVSIYCFETARTPGETVMPGPLCLIVSLAEGPTVVQSGWISENATETESRHAVSVVDLRFRPWPGMTAWTVPSTRVCLGIVGSLLSGRARPPPLPCDAWSRT